MIAAATDRVTAVASAATAATGRVAACAGADVVVAQRGALVHLGAAPGVGCVGQPGPVLAANRSREFPIQLFLVGVFESAVIAPSADVERSSAATGLEPLRPRGCGLLPAFVGLVRYFL